MKAHKRQFIAPNGNIIKHDDLMREVQKEATLQGNAIYEKAARDILPQAMATFLWTMHTNFGFGPKRIADVAEALIDTGNLMLNPSKLHHRFGGLDCVEWLKKYAGVDAEEAYKAEVEFR